MNIIDHDLLSVQQARVLAETARNAQKAISTYSQEQLDKVVFAMIDELQKHTEALAKLSVEETEYGNVPDKIIKNRFMCNYLAKKLKDMKCVGIIAKHEEERLTDIGVPVGVIGAFVSAVNPSSTVIHNTLIAIKSANAIIFSPHPRAIKTISTVLDILIKTAKKCGMPDGVISYMSYPCESGAKELINHRDISLLLITGDENALKLSQKSGKPVLYGGAGNGPVFIERTANIEKAVADIIASRTFDYGVVSACEQSVVADGKVAGQIKKAFKEQGGYFLTDEEAERLEGCFYFKNGRENTELIGKSAEQLAVMAGISAPKGTKVLIAEKDYVADASPYSKARLFPVLAFYIEDDWVNACEKCIELLVDEGKGHTLVIHSNDEHVINEFALKKPVSRVLVNTPASFGSMGATTNLFPSMTLGSGAIGSGITADNISPLHLVNIRRVGREVRKMRDINLHNISPNDFYTPKTSQSPQKLAEVMEELLRQLASKNDF